MSVYTVGVYLRTLEGEAGHSKPWKLKQSSQVQRHRPLSRERQQAEELFAGTGEGQGSWTGTRGVGLENENADHSPWAAF